MKPLRHLLPSVNALVVFESAARLTSFTRAAEELGISQPAVSRHIANLEMFVGRSLFRRRHNRLDLTDAGTGLRDAVSLGLGHVATALDALRQTGRRNELRIACNFGFAYTWLMPRFSRLRDALAEWDLRLVTSDVALDYDSPDIDVSVRFGDGHWPDRRARQILVEEVVPVAAPDVLASLPDLGPDGDPASLLDAPLLHFDRGGGGWLTWPLWFEALGVRHQLAEAGYHFQNYAFLLQAAREGRGIALGWRHLIDPDLDLGALVAVGPMVRRAAAGYWLVWDPARVPDALADRITDWFAVELQRPTVR